MRPRRAMQRRSTRISAGREGTGLLPVFAVLALGAAVLTLTACGGGATTEPGDAGAEAEAPVETTAPAEIEDQPATPEAVALEAPERGEPVEAEEPEADTTAAELSALEKELELRERELALKERELELKERELAQKRREARPAVAVPQPAPEPTPEPTPEPVEERAEAAPQPAPEAEPEPEPRVVWLDVPAGREMEVEFLSSLSTATSREGDTFRTRVMEPIYAGSGELAIPAGSEVLGRVVESVTNDRRIGGRSRLAIEFTDLVLPSGTTVPVSASLAEEGKSGKGKDAATIGGATAAGAILGRILGDEEAAVVGAILGGAAGSVLASRNKGENVEIASGTPVRLRLDETVAVRTYR